MDKNSTPECMMSLFVWMNICLFLAFLMSMHVGKQNDVTLRSVAIATAQAWYIA